ncbi:MAG: 16S rRNA (uracil(1498)-N(3))-methyltransferase [Pirellulales bacterium]|jgi:16S rRNA (uracil1498-N3)-methyltransferase|nr:16S rRNA (uracil(1498)-N(3))-methyltransferase [Pirellulales bacterium]
MPRRYFLETRMEPDSEVAELTGQEAQHLAKVMRAQPGDQVELFDGSGFQFAATVSEVTRHSVNLRIQSREQVSREANRRVTIAVSLPKGDRQKWLVEKLCEVGVTTIIPLKTERSVAQPTDKALTRLRRCVIEASKQCGRNTLMEIESPQSLGELIEQTNHEVVRFIAHPYSSEDTAASNSDITAINTNGSVIAAIGPEGGFSEDEVDSAVQSGFKPLSIGSRILRIETASIAISSLFIYTSDQ